MSLKVSGKEIEVSFTGESESYRKARNELVKAEIALKDQREKVAQMRRALPLGALVKQEYIFKEGPRDIDQKGPITDVKLSQLFEDEKDELILINMMFAPGAERPCPMCNMWADGYNAIAPHVQQQKNFALVTKTDIHTLRTWAKGRGWKNIRLLSSFESPFNEDFNVQYSDQEQVPGVTVFKKLPDGKIYHTYSVEAAMVPYEHRAIDLFSPVWNLFDLTPSGRAPTWYPKTSYSL